MMDKKPEPPDPRDVIHPREAANWIEEKCLLARIKAGSAHRSASIEIAVDDAFVIAKLLRRVPLKRGNQPKTTREERYFSIVVDKARRRKEELRGEGKTPLDAEARAAAWASKGTPWAAETIARAMHNKKG